MDDVQQLQRDHALHQESRIRHLDGTLEKYMAGLK